MDIWYHLKMKLWLDKIIRFIIYFVVTVMNFVVTVLTPTNALEQPQLILKATNNAILDSQFAAFLGRVEVLKPNDICSFKNLTECHYSEELYNLYHDACFTEQICPKDKYYCINGVGYTVHICGEFGDCMKRKRNIVVFDESHPGVVDVYSIPCPDGYFQFSLGNCFHACVKDDSVIVTKESTGVTHAQAYCNYERKYCNLDGFTSFSLGSQYDNCVDVNYDDNGEHCNDSEDLMPNCSCVPSCLLGQVRTFSRHFVCQWPNRSNIIRRTTKGVTEYYGATTVASHHTSQKIDTNGRVQTSKDNNQGNSVVIALVCMAYKLLIGRAPDYRGVPVRYNRNEGHPEEGTVQHENGVAPGPVTKVKNKNVTHNNINIHTDHDIHVQAGNGHAVPSIDIRDMACELSCADHHSQESNDEPQMENLKFPVSKEGDSGIASTHASSETTYVKRSY
ncbi:uncharacterized protein LOC128551498 isoform X2 [Mercenaria mercenaria]|uniref:uncharacterized protein LOC128551498 isoform X2 n=1 Tax=Mercenaria mercenaria TaxID=6596 RepID=UPI00234EE0B8|nr:uncharacterized protein LOC128551498 isoform X2 [Mercenaria mercenaria]